MHTNEITIAQTKKFIGAIFNGSYDETSQYLDEIKERLNQQDISFEEFETLSIYYSDPDTTDVDDLTSFNGFLLSDDIVSDSNFEIIELEKGTYIVSSCSSPEEIWNMFGEIYTYAQKNRIVITDAPPFLITSIEDGKPKFSLYLKSESMNGIKG